jgi:hypothetical protein
MYWTFFNILGRIVGTIFLVGGIIMDVLGFVSLRNHQGQPFDTWIGISLCSIMAILGFLMIIARPYRPEGSEKENNDS